MKFAWTAYVLLLLGVSCAVARLGGIPTPFQSRWSLKMEGYAVINNEPPQIPPLTINNDVLLVWTDGVQGGNQELSAVSIKDGSLLWTLPSFVVNISSIEDVTVPFVRAGHLRKGKAVADIYGTFISFSIQGYVVLDLEVKWTKWRLNFLNLSTDGGRN
mgnify:FL=1